MRRLLLCIVSCFIIPAQPALAESLPESYRGLWAYPACDKPAEVLLYEPGYVLQATARQAQMNALVVQARADHYLRVGEGGMMFFLERNGERLNRIGLALPNGVWPEKLDPNNPALRVRHYQYCTRVPAAWPSLNEDGLVLFRRLGRIADACIDAASCWRAQFAAADRNGNGTLDYSELARGWRALAYLAGLQSQCTFHEIFPGRTAQTGPHFALAAVALADRDQDLALSQEELQNAAGALLDHDEYGTVLRGRLAAVRPYMPLLSDDLCAGQKTCRPCGRHE